MKGNEVFFPRFYAKKNEEVDNERVPALRVWVLELIRVSIWEIRLVFGVQDP